MTPQTIAQSQLILNNNVKPKDRILYATIWKELNQVVTNRCIEDGIVDLPLLGTISISRYKLKIRFNQNGIPNIPVNWGKTNAARKAGTLKSDKVIYSNKGYVFKFKWKRPYVKHIKSYSFSPSRTNDVQCKTGFLNRFYAFIAETDTNYLKYPMKN
jgi:hypothetical protein